MDDKELLSFRNANNAQKYINDKKKTESKWLNPENMEACSKNENEENSQRIKKPKMIENLLTDKESIRDEEVDKVFSCETLRMCIITTLNWGLRNGGGIGDVLRNVDPQVFLI